MITVPFIFASSPKSLNCFFGNDEALKTFSLGMYVIYASSFSIGGNSTCVSCALLSNNAIPTVESGKKVNALESDVE